MFDDSPSVFAIGGVSNLTAEIILPRAVDELVGTTLCIVEERFFR